MNATMNFKDYYKALGLKRESNEKDVKDAFKKLAKKYHPDAQGGSEEKFKEINEAYEVLKDKNKRSRYDYMYTTMDHRKDPFDVKSQTFKQKKMYSNLNNFTEFYKQKERENIKEQANKRRQRSKEEENENFSDFFEMFFGKHKEETQAAANAEAERRKAKQKKSANGEDFEMDIELSLEDAYHGCVRKIEITTTANNIRRLEVSIPPGVRTGTKIKVANEGKQGKNGGKNGDLYLQVKLKEHEQFWLDEDDVHSEITLLPHEAVLGASKKIPTLEDIVELVIPPKTYNGRILRLRDKGLRDSQGEILGDHYVHINIDIPRDLSDEELVTYKYLRELNDKK